MKTLKPKLPLSYIRGFLCCLWLLVTLCNIALGWWNIRTMTDSRRTLFITMQAADDIQLLRNVKPIDFIQAVNKNQ